MTSFLKILCLIFFSQFILLPPSLSQNEIPAELFSEHPSNQMGLPTNASGTFGVPTPPPNTQQSFDFNPGNGQNKKRSIPLADPLQNIEGTGGNRNFVTEKVKLTPEEVERLKQSLENEKSGAAPVENSSEAFMPVPTTLDEALGELQINDKKCAFTVAYAQNNVDLLNAKKVRQQILFLDSALPAKAFKQLDSLQTLTQDKSCWTLIEFDEKQKITSLEFPFAKDERFVHSAPNYPFLRTKIEVVDNLIGGTLYFKEPLLVSKNKIQGKISFRTQIRNLGNTALKGFQRGKSIAAETEQPVQIFYDAVKNLKSRAPASTSSPENNNPNKIIPPGDLRLSDPNLLPSDFKFIKGRLNSKGDRALVALEGSFEKDGPKVLAIAMLIKDKDTWSLEKAEVVSEFPQWL